MKKLIKWLTYKITTSREEYMRATQADKLCGFIWEFQQYLRTQNKYADPPDSIEIIYKKWFQMLQDEGVDLESIYS